MGALAWRNLAFLWTALGAAGGLLLLLHFLERAAGRFVAHRLGWRGVLLTGWLGVPVHELGHLCAAVLFRHRIIDFRLFAPDPVTGTLGYVRHACRRRAPWQLLGNTLIPLAPLVSGAAALALLALWMVPVSELRALWGEAARSASRADSLAAGAEALWRSLWAMAGAVWEHRTPWLPVQLYLALCVASHLGPSPADLRAALPGIAVLAALLSLAALGAAHAGVGLDAPMGLLLGPFVLLCLGVAALQGLHVAAVGMVSTLFQS